MADTYNSAYTGKQIDEAISKIIDGIIIKSSTEGSTKLFKLLVDDTGRIAVEEIS